MHQILFPARNRLASAGQRALAALPHERFARHGSVSQPQVKLGEGANGQIKKLPAGALDQRQVDFDFDPQDFRFTVGKDGALYAFCLAVPTAGASVKITSLGSRAGLLKTPVRSVSLLGSKARLVWKQEGDGLTITCPDSMPFKTAIGFKIR
ncbi:MAG: alpha-L-fucosidase C-terminal domain-containing protein [Chthoniobacteraceae bacterium]